jgi:hypothetical protein
LLHHLHSTDSHCTALSCTEHFSWQRSKNKYHFLFGLDLSIVNICIFDSIAWMFFGTNLSFSFSKSRNLEISKSLNLYLSISQDLNLSLSLFSRSLHRNSYRLGSSYKLSKTGISSGGRSSSTNVVGIGSPSPSRHSSQCDQANVRSLAFHALCHSKWCKRHSIWMNVDDCFGQCRYENRPLFQ